jgi:thymidylate kinase
MKAVSEAVRPVLEAEGFDPNNKIHLTHHPGSTPLGAHLRTLVKTPEQIDSEIIIDPLSRQMLYMVDTVSFAKSRLEPALEKGEFVFADRSSFISSLVYGCAEGVSIEEIQRLFAIYDPPKADRLYVLRCPWTIAKERMMQDRGDNIKLDYYDRKEDGFFDKIIDLYDNLLTGPPERTVAVSRSVQLNNVIYIDATQPIDRVVDEILDDFKTVLRQRVSASSE